ncbi:hypothetical protein [Roseateles sp. BYS96W]|uniref:Uncharacterized protein n=1 Tax=Pelomonas nitida TaxID=3299027 RepID=A0ABW7G520_9BURK
MNARRCQHCASVCAVLLALNGCATNPYVFSPKLNTKQIVSKPEDRLVGELDLSLQALMDQRDLLWKAAGDTETMKNMTALGLIGLGATAVYKGLDKAAHETFLKKAGLGTAAIYAGASWLEPSARQKVYLAGAESLTCLALQVAPYEMTRADFDKERAAIIKARQALERVYAQLAVISQAPRGSAEARSIGRAWGIVRWAGRQLDDADRFLGGLERVGPHLREMSALTASDTARQVERVSHDLSEVPAAVAQLKSQANLLLAQTIFASPASTSDAAASADNTPTGDPAADKNAAAASCPASTETTTEEPTSPAKAAAETAISAKKDADQADKNATAATAAVSDAKEESTKKAATDKATAATAAAKAAREKAKNAQAKAEQLKQAEAQKQAREAAELAAVQVQLPELNKRLTVLAQALGQPTSLNKRLTAALERPALPKACGTPSVRVIPDKRDLLLTAGESFQFVIEGDDGRPSVQWLAQVPSDNVIDVSLPAMRDTAAVRFTASASAPKTTTMLARISDSKRTVSVDVTIKVCAAKPPHIAAK